MWAVFISVVTSSKLPNKHTKGRLEILHFRHFGSVQQLKKFWRRICEDLSKSVDVIVYCIALTV